MVARNSIITILGIVILILGHGIFIAGLPVSTRCNPQSLQELPVGNGDDNEIFSGTYNSRGKIHDDSWMDTFEDWDGIDGRDNLNISSGEAKLELDGDNVVFNDEFTTDPLDATKWDDHVGGGTQLLSSPVLMAIKLGEAQTENAYIETDTSWPVERIVEWEWNSVLEGGFGGYDHTICTYYTASESIWVTIQGDRRVILEQTTSITSDPVYTISENTWYNMYCKISSNEVVFTIRNETGVLLNTQTLVHQITGTGKIRTVFASVDNTLASFDVRLDNFKISSGYFDSASLTSVKINLPSGRTWDTLGLNKLEPSSTYIRVNILDGESSQQLSGFSNINGIAVDISSIDPDLHPSLKLYITFERSPGQTTTPILYQLGLSWVADKVWQDTFVSASKILEMNNVVVTEGEVKLSEGEPKGSLTSKPVYLPETYLWNSILVDKTEPFSTSISLTIIDHPTGETIGNFDSSASLLKIYAIDPIAHPVIRLKAILYGNETETPILFRWNINWSANSPPEILDFQTHVTVLRTETVPMFAKCYDTETELNELELKFEHRSSSETYWQTSYFSDKKFYNNYWVVNFTPPKTAILGNYTIRISCTDKYEGSTLEFFEDVIAVKNNKPGHPELEIVPEFPTSSDDLKCVPFNVTDLEDEPINYSYKWYKNNELQPEFTTDMLPSQATSRDEVWKCIVTPNDGHDDGEPAEVDVIIENSPPRIYNPVHRIAINEDIVDCTSINLYYIFYDSDNDPLQFSKSGAENISVKIFDNNGTVMLQPKRDWHGNENIIFFANDSKYEASHTIFISVFPINDAPEIKRINNMAVSRRNNVTVIAEVNQDLYLTVEAYDLDGDRLYYMIQTDNNTSNTPPTNLKIDGITGELWYRPGTEDIGLVTVNISVTDNNGSSDWKQITFSVIETAKPWYEFDVRSMLMMVILVLFIIVIISSLVFKEWKARKKRREAESMLAQTSTDTCESKVKTLSIVEMLNLLNWHYSRNELDTKTYKELKKEIMAMDGDSIKVNILTSKLALPEEPAPLPQPDVHALEPPPVSTTPLPMQFELPRLPPHKEEEEVIKDI